MRLVNLSGSAVASIAKDGAGPAGGVWNLDFQSATSVVISTIEGKAYHKSSIVAASDTRTDLIPGVSIVLDSSISAGDQVMIEARDMGDPTVDQRIQALNYAAGTDTSIAAVIDVSVVAPGSEIVLLSAIGVSAALDVGASRVEITQGGTPLQGSYMFTHGNGSVIALPDPLVFPTASGDITLTATFTNTSTFRTIWARGWYE